MSCAGAALSFPSYLRGVLIIVLTMLGAAGMASAQKPAARHVAVVMEGSHVRLQPQLNGLRDGLEELKYLEGDNLQWSLVSGDSTDELRAKLQALLQRQQVDLLVTLGTLETVAAKTAAPAMPIVFLPVADPVRAGFVQSLANPGGNLTGLAFFTGEESVGKQLEVFKQAVPSLRKVLAVFDDRGGNGTHNNYWKRLRAVADWLGVELAEQGVTSTADAARKIESSRVAPGAGVFLVCSGLFKDVAMIAAAAVRRRLPLFGCNAFQVAEQNALLSYGPDLYSLGYRGAWFVDRLFRGARPRELPVEMPRRYELAINTRAAGQIGLNISTEVLMLTDRVFK